jgi:hypothetical protein
MRARGRARSSMTMRHGTLAPARMGRKRRVPRAAPGCRRPAAAGGGADPEPPFPPLAV